MDLAILIRMPVITRMLMANGPWPDEQQSVSLSGSIVDKFKQQLRPEFPHVPLVEHTLCFYRSQDLLLYKATKKSATTTAAFSSWACLLHTNKADRWLKNVVVYIMIFCPSPLPTTWPSGLRRQFKALVFTGVGSNPTVVSIHLSLQHSWSFPR